MTKKAKLIIEYEGEGLGATVLEGGIVCIKSDSGKIDARFVRRTRMSRILTWNLAVPLTAAVLVSLVSVAVGNYPMAAWCGSMA